MLMPRPLTWNSNLAWNAPGAMWNGAMAQPSHTPPGPGILGSMKSATCSLVLLLATGSLNAQVVPTTPKKFATREIGAGGSSSAGVSVPPPKPATVRTVTYITLTPPRQWTSSDGRSLLGKLVAFEDFFVETVAGQPAPPMPELRAPPTVVKDGKARLLVSDTPYEIALEKLSAGDREFIEKIRQAVAKKK